MKRLRVIGLLLGKTLLVTAAVALGFAVGEALGFPDWLQGVFLAPAGYLFYRLSGETPPPWWQIVGLLLLVSVMTSGNTQPANSPFQAILAGILIYLIWCFIPSQRNQKDPQTIIKPDP
jgi:hypothetical protein